MDRSKKILLSVLLVTIIATASSSLFSANPTVYVNPWMDTYYRYEKIDNHWVTHNSVDNSTMPGLFMPVNCKNNGATVAEFYIIVTFNGTCFSADTPHPTKVNSTAASFEFILKVGNNKQFQYTSKLILLSITLLLHFQSKLSKIICLLNQYVKKAPSMVTSNSSTYG